ncbi:MAG: SpoIIIAH-like family protein [Lachnospiraceae bacterium]|nr:SpoIIIAH-like family protein [Lachnospiraceae bacterium]
MKKIIGKNQVIISALAIMIAVAGYLSITQDNELKETGMGNSEEVAETIYDISDSDIYDESGVDLSDTGELVTPATEGPAPTVNPVDTAEVQQTDKNIGEAVLVSSTIGAEYFDSARLQREQTRSKNKEILMELINSTVATEAQKEQAVEEVINLTSDSEKENSAESMLMAKGYGECIVNIVDGKVDVIVGADSLTEKDIAQIEDIVKRKTDANASDIVITPVGIK